MRRNGFTLLELLIVLVIAASVVTLAAPQFSRLTSAVALRSSARELASALRSARSEAIAQHRDAAVVIDLEQRTYRLEGSPRAHPLGARFDLELLTAQSEARNKELGAIRFFADGSSTGGRVTLAIVGQRYVVDVDWLTGRVVIHD